MSIFSYPKVEAPTVVRGWVKGPFLRWESLTGPEIMTGAMDYVPGVFHDGDGFVLENVRPWELPKGLYGLSEMQKYSTFGWLRFDPFVKVWWDMPGLQEKRPDGSWIPGTEKGTMWRSPGRRWDIPGTNGEHWPRTWGRYFSENWD